MCARVRVCTCVYVPRAPAAWAGARAWGRRESGARDRRGSNEWEEVREREGGHASLYVNKSDVSPVEMENKKKGTCDLHTTPVHGGHKKHTINVMFLT